MNKKTVDTLYVYYQESKVGEIFLDEEDRLEFKYNGKWLKNSEKFQLSYALPLREESFGHKETISFFENLLPEGQLRKRLEQIERIPENNNFEFIKKHGKDCAGAIVVTLDEDFSYSYDPNALIKIEKNQIYQSIKEKKSLAEVVGEISNNYLSLAGVQDKIPCILQRGEIFIPQKGNPSTHIIKPPIATYDNTKDSVFNEYFCSRLAQKIGLNVPKVDIIEGEVPLFVIERYDREIKNGVVQRIHQQDFCQAHGVISSRKYQSQGGPSFEMNYDLVKDKSSNALKDLRSLLDWLLFNLLIGNNDTHSKNLGLLYVNAKVRLAPFYDLLSTTIYPQLHSNFAYKIADKTVWTNLKKEDFNSLEKLIGVRNNFVVELLKEMAKNLQQQVVELIKEFDCRFKNENVASKIALEIEKRIKRFQYKNIL